MHWDLFWFCFQSVSLLFLFFFIQLQMGCGSFLCAVQLLNSKDGYWLECHKIWDENLQTPILVPNVLMTCVHWSGLNGVKVCLAHQAGLEIMCNFIYKLLLLRLLQIVRGGWERKTSEAWAEGRFGRTAIERQWRTAEERCAVICRAVWSDLKRDFIIIRVKFVSDNRI